MKGKVWNIVAWVIQGFAALSIIASGIFKLLSPPQVVEGLTKLGVGAYIQVLGIAEIIFAILFLIPKTTKIGFLLITCYFAGAIATDLSHGNSIANATFVQVLVWIAAFLKKPEIFLNQPSTAKS